MRYLECKVDSEHKEKTARQVLADGGKRDMTAPEWIEATRVEEEGRAREERLKRGYKTWRDAELVERRVRNKQIDVEWDA